MSLEKAKEFLEKIKVNCHNSNSIFNTQTYVKIEDAIKAVEMVEQPTVDTWIQFTSEYSEEYEIEIMNCRLPDDDEEILVTNGRSVWKDTFFRDGRECYLDGGYGFTDEVIAWQPLPKPFEPKQEE